MGANGPDRIGFGLSTPFRREAADFAGDSGGRLVEGCVRRVLGVRGSGWGAAGEYPWRRGMGSSLDRLRHSNLRESARDLAAVYATDAVRTWEPRAEVDPGRTTQTRDSGDSRLLRIRVYFGLTNEPGTMAPGASGGLFYEVAL